MIWGWTLKKEGGTYADLYEEKVKEVLKIVPKAHVFINSIIPPTAENPRWGKANEYNTQLKAMCEKNGWTYIDVTSVTDDGNQNIIRQMVFTLFVIYTRFGHRK